MNELYQKMNFRLTRDPKLAEVYLPCGYTWVENELREYDPVRGQIILAIDGCDKIVAKDGLWKVLSDEYGRDRASELVPRSYVTNSPIDINYLKVEYDPGKIYIMKKNVQRQQGLKMTKNLSEMLPAAQSGYVVIQEYLMNPLLFDKRKFDIRVFLLIIKKGEDLQYYRHTGGRCHYTTQDFKVDDLSRDIHIPSGYREDNEFKDAHPETLKELREYMNKYRNSYRVPERRFGDYLFNRIDQLLWECCVAFSKVLGHKSKFSEQGTVQCQLFGLDILSDEALRPILIEINKGPEMDWSSEPERQYKKKLAEDMFNLLGYTKSDVNEFIPIKKYT
uniref:Tubulin-tyrosine ligase family protein n=1 Tax=Marseillevirus LCMAC201 TaxID=2506605 RepID=A0A481YWG9_9VIRU|nr:MAG: tubulin-tyrosine ligase family protein [Marseillevirus LCMAC201]